MMNDYGLVSVIIPTYNREKTIKRSIDSVLAQDYTHIEVIIVDDCSDDDTKNIVKGIKDERVRYIKLDNNSGACVARNVGIENARGEYLAFHDSDDVWIEAKLSKQLRALLMHGADICSCQIDKHHLNDTKPAFIFPNINASGYISHDKLCSRSYVGTQTILAKNIVCHNNKFDPNIKKGQDFEWVIRASMKYSVYMLKDILVHQYIQDNSISLGGIIKTLESRLYMLDQYKKIYDLKREKVLHSMLLRNIANIKTLLQEKDAVDYYRELLKIDKNVYNYVMYLCSKYGVLYYIAKIFGKKIDTI